MSPGGRLPVELIVKLAEGDSLLEENDDREVRENGLPFTRLASVLPQGARVRMSFPRFARRLRGANHPLDRPGGGGSLDRFLRVRLAGSPENVRALLAQIRAHPDVERAVLALPTRPAAVTTAELQALQTYLGDAPAGVAAESVWEEADGSGIRACVCDTAYAAHDSLAHVEYMADVYVPLLPGTTDYDALRHGTAALGVIGARPYGPSGDEGPRGIAYGARLAFAAVTGDGTLDDAIDRALGNTRGASDGLESGDVLVLEHATCLGAADQWVLGVDGAVGPQSFPVEVNPDVFRAIEAAVGRGVTVVEPAGNGGGSLTGWYEGVDSEGDLFDWDPAGDDSGAILVGGGVLADGTQRVRWTGTGAIGSGTNYGPRVDCHAEASTVVSPCCEVGGIPANDVLSEIADGPARVVARWLDATSAATAIVGGVVTLLQSLHRARTSEDGLAGVPLYPEEVRTLLRDDDLGTVQTFLPTETNPFHRVGPQPDLSKLAALPFTAVVMMLDAESESRWLGAKYLKYRCPDILVSKPAPRPPPFDHPGLRGTGFVPDDAADGVSVRVRVRNRTPKVRDVEATLWWSEPAPFVHPRYWHALGTLPVDGVPAGGIKASAPLRLPDTVPPGAKSWIAGAADENDPLRHPDVHMSTRDFLLYLRRSGGVRILNRQRRVLGPGSLPFRWRLRGVPEDTLVHRLAFRTSLPGDTLIVLETEHPLQGVTGTHRVADLRGRPLRVRLAPGDDVGVRMRVVVPPGSAFDWTPITVDQLLDAHQLGRITFEVSREEDSPV